MGILALESTFIFGLISNFYRYIVLKIPLDLFLAIFSTIGAAILFVFIIMILASYLDKRKVLRSFQKQGQNRRTQQNK
jgi:Na+/H+-dicarboxylate symporter